LTVEELLEMEKGSVEEKELSERGGQVQYYSCPENEAIFYSCPIRFAKMGDFLDVSKMKVKLADFEYGTQENKRLLMRSQKDRRGG
jgi:hypothetical protein